MSIFDSKHFSALLRQARAGSSEALGKLLEPFRMHLLVPENRAVPAALQGRLDNAELIQETFHSAVRSFAQFRGKTEAELFAWLRQIRDTELAQLSRRHLQTQKRAVSREVSLDNDFFGRALGELIPDDDATPFTSTMTRERMDIMYRAFALLKPEHQEIIRLRHEGGQSFAEIAAKLGKTTKAVEHAWHRVLQAWRQAMKDLGLKEW